MLHLTNGDAAAEPLRQSGVPGKVIVWADVLHEGPAPMLHGETWRRTRAQYLAAAGYGSFDDLLAISEQWDAALERYREHDELVLWFEHDVFDQLLLARHLHWLGTQGHVATRLSLICIDRFPGVEPFHGLGQLTPGQLASLFPTRAPIADGQLHAGAEVWRAFTAPDPRALAAAAASGIPTLPFIAGALVRFLEDFPGAQDGLSRTERSTLEELTAGPRTPESLFAALRHREERVFMGDLAFWTILRDMARDPAPLIAMATGEPFDRQLPTGRVTLAPVGRSVLNGEADAVRLRGLDRWRGGVHLTPDNAWRWDRERRGILPPGLT
jgi:hypothetical protein